MNKETTDRKPILNVFLSTQPEVPPVYITSSLSESGQVVPLNSREHIFAEGRIVSHYLYGQDITARFSSCFMKRTKVMYSVPAQPVVSFHIQLSNGFRIKYASRKGQSQYAPDQYRLYWQNEEIIAYELQGEVSDHLDLFFRPSHFLALADRYPILRELAAEVATASPGDLNYYVNCLDDDMLDFVDQILLEFSEFEISHQRFTYLCECLLLHAMKISITVEPMPSEAIRRTDEQITSEWKDYVFTENQKSVLSDLKMLSDKNDLILKLNEVILDYLDCRKKAIDHRELIEDIKNYYAKVMGDSANLLAEAYFWIAKKLDKQLEIYGLTETEHKNVGKAIITLCTKSFELRSPAPAQLALYSKWTEQPYKGEIGMQEFGRLLNIFIPEMNIPLEKLDNSRESKAILDQYLQDRLGITPLSHDTRGKAEEKSREVIELYQILVQMKADEFEITPGGEIKKSDEIRILDHAYETNDLMQLLRMEIDCFREDESYIEKQNAHKIGYWILALQEANADLKKQFHNREKGPLSRLVEAYYCSMDKMEAVERKAQSLKVIYEKIVQDLLTIGQAMEGEVKKEIFLLLAESLIVAAEYPFKTDD